MPPLSATPLLDLAARVSNRASRLMDRVPQSLHSARHTETLQADAACSNALEGEDQDEYIAAHVRAERALDVIGYVGKPALGSTVLRAVHRELFSDVDSDQFEPGIGRTQNVKVQRHVPPHHESLAGFLERADEAYLRPWKSSAELLIAVAASHHRMTWIHPLRDGNGRAIRLQSTLALRPMGSHFWSLSAGLWRRKADYFRMLAEADSHRLGDLDGRGNLSEKRLVEWCDFFVSVVDEEVQTAAQQLGVTV